MVSIDLFTERILIGYSASHESMYYYHLHMYVDSERNLHHLMLSEYTGSPPTVRPDSPRRIDSNSDKFQRSPLQVHSRYHDIRPRRIILAPTGGR